MLTDDIISGIEKTDTYKSHLTRLQAAKQNGINQLIEKNNLQVNIVCQQKYTAVVQDYNAKLNTISPFPDEEFEINRKVGEYVKELTKNYIEPLMKYESFSAYNNHLKNLATAFQDGKKQHQ